MAKRDIDPRSSLEELILNYFGLLRELQEFKLVSSTSEDRIRYENDIVRVKGDLQAGLEEYITLWKGEHFEIPGNIRQVINFFPDLVEAKQIFQDRLKNEPGQPVKLQTSPTFPQDKEHTRAENPQVPGEGKTRLLFLAPNPARARLSISDERQAIQELLEKPGYAARFELVPADNIKSLEEIEAKLSYVTPHLVHFSCHATAGGYLVFYDAKGDTVLISAEQIKNALSSLSKPARCVVLSACFSRSLVNRLKKWPIASLPPVKK